ncbi:MAG: hypothetical protein L6290_03010 [Thermodesulfovibrionales bacterium]|nr:hypothetical protein [Thermodesulfovibrionales bacterium]
MDIRIDCYLSLTCGSEDALRENIAQALLSAQVSADVNFHRIHESEAASLGLHGSPSVLLNGKDIQPVDIKGFA